jgi:CubicO group peptidase (beta-lactamase class C family)
MNRTEIETILNDAVASGRVAGVAAAVTDANETIFQHAAGTTELGAGQPVTADTLFWIASMTKPITSVAAMQLVEQGRLHLDKPIGDLLPDLAHPVILEDGKTRPATKPITLRQLLTHTAGFSYGFASAELAAYIAAHNLPTGPGQRASLKIPLLFEPGERWEYGISTDWVGQAVEAASGQTLDQYFLDHITGPLGMADTVFLPSPEQWSRRTAIHQRQPDGALTIIPPPPRNRPEFFSGGGGLHSTLADYQKFLRIFLNDGAGIIGPATVAEMSRNQIGRLRAGIIPSADLAFNTPTEVYPGMDAKWGLGFLINPERGRFGRGPGSLNWAGVANTYFWIDPGPKFAAVIMMQTLPAGDPGAIMTYCGFESAIYAAPH